MLFSCKEEIEIIPDVVEPEYNLPQGNHSYDARIVDFYKENSCYILYKFSNKDFRWNITRQISFVADQADEAMVGQSLDFLEDKLFRFYTKDFLKKSLPYKILLASRIRALEGSLNAPDTIAAPVAATYTISNLAFGHCNNKLLTLTDPEIYKIKNDLHSIFWQSAVSGGRIEMPPLFVNATNYLNVYSFNIKTHGVIKYGNGFSINTDFSDYIELITTHTLAELESTLFLKINDPNGRYRFKYDAIINYYKSNYQIDLQKIKNDE